MQINGPASANYDIDLGTFPLTDYYWQSADEGVSATLNGAGPPPSNNILFNGSAINATTDVGSYGGVTLTKGKVHRLRLLNTGKRIPQTRRRLEGVGGTGAV